MMKMADRGNARWIYFAAVLVMSPLIVAVVVFAPDYTFAVRVAIIVIAIAVAAVVTATVRKTDAKLEYDGLHVRGPMLNEDIPYGDIASLEMREGMKYGMRITGYSAISRLGGNFRNSEFGNYKLGVKTSVKRCIVVRKADEKVLVFNLETAEKTTQFYSDLKRKTGR